MATGIDAAAGTGWELPALDKLMPTDTTIVAWGDEIEIVDVDTFEYEDTVKRLKMSAPACVGFILNFPDGKSPHTAYPFALHDTLVLPWDYLLKNGVMKLFA